MDVAPTGGVSDLESRFFVLALAALALSTLLAFLSHTNWWWGANLLAFYPEPARIAWAIAFLAALVLLRFRPRRAPEAPDPPAAVEPGPVARSAPAALIASGAALLAGGVFHLFRARSFLLGDGTHIVIHLARQEPPAPRAALYNLLETGVTTWLRGSRHIPTLAEAGFLSTLVGAIFIGLAVCLLLARARSTSGAAATALGVLVFLQPSMQLFFGYVEAYALLAAPLMIFFLLAFDAAERRRSVAVTVAPAAVALVAHPFGATTIPAIGLLMVGTDPRGLRRRIPWILGVFLALFTGLFLLFAVWPAGRAVDSPVRFLAPQEYAALLEQVIRNIMKTPHWSRLYTSASPEHWADVANHLWLTGAPALVVLGALALAASGRRALRRFPVAVALAGTAGVLVIRALLRTVLGAARDWDLFAPVGIGLTAIAGTALAIWIADRRAADPSGDPRRDTAVRRMIAGAAAVSLFFLVPWLGLQTDIERTAQRHLAIVDGRPPLEPIAAGDYHAAMGDRLFFIGQYPYAARAYDRAYVLWPTYMHALRAGQSYLAAGELERSAVALHRALELRPDDRTAIVELGNVLNGLNAFSLADSFLTRAIALYPDYPLPRLHRARTLAMMGRDAEARALLETARPLMKPDDPALSEFTRLDTTIAGRPADAPPVSESGETSAP